MRIRGEYGLPGRSRGRDPGAQPVYEGNVAIEVFPVLPCPPVLLNYQDIVGSKTGALLPTGSVRDVFEGVEVTCIDVAVPLVIIAAAALGKQGGETPAELNADAEWLDRLEGIRRAAAWRMGFGDVQDKVMPKVALISARPRRAEDSGPATSCRTSVMRPTL